MECLAAALNPWALSTGTWLACVVGKEVALQGMDMGVAYFCQCLKQLPSRTGSKTLYQNRLGYKDGLYLASNSVIEAIFISHLLRLMWESTLVVRPLSSLTLFNGPVALLLLILFNDMLYAPAHRFLHHPVIYPYIHKHHHRSVYPSRGNIDARNEHPVEQLIAMALWTTAIYLAACISGLHWVTIAVHIFIMSAGAMLNHCGYDLDISFLGVDWYSTRAHEMHHRRPDKNFAQFTMFWDKLMGTYIPYIHDDLKENDPHKD